MKTYLVIVLVLLTLVPVANAYSFGESIKDIGNFLREYFILTGNAILSVKDSLQEAKQEQNVESASPPDVKKAITNTQTTQTESTGPIPSSTNPESTSVVSEGPTTEIEETNTTSTVTHTPTCSDYVDNNINYYKKGICQDERGQFLNREYPSDYCNLENDIVMEYSCINNFCSGSWFVCPNGCRDGACVSDENIALDAELSVVGIVFNPVNPKVNEIVDINARIKNTGTKGTTFERTFIVGAVEDTEFIDYFLEPGETIEIDLIEMAFNTGQYPVTVSVGDSTLTETLEVGKEEPPEVTSEAVKEVKQEETFLNRVINLILGVFR